MLGRCNAAPLLRAHRLLVEDLEPGRVGQHPATVARLCAGGVAAQREHAQPLEHAQHGDRAAQLALVLVPMQLIVRHVQRLQPQARLQLAPARADLVAAEVEHLQQRDVPERRHGRQMVPAQIEPRQLEKAEAHARPAHQRVPAGHEDLERREAVELGERLQSVVAEQDLLEGALLDL